MEPQSHRVRANGLDHHVLEWSPGPGGSSERATAMLLHGFQDCAATWDVVASDLAAQTGLRVLAPDQRGFGDGARVPAGGYYYFPDYVADALAVASEMGAAPLFLVGHSMGATVVSYVAGAFPERVAKLALIDGVGPPDNPRDVAPARMRRWIETTAHVHAQTFATVDEATTRLSRYNPDIDRTTLERKAAQLVREVDGGFSWKHDPLHSTVSPIPFFVESYRAFARSVTCPTLHVSGGTKGHHVPDEEERLACFADLTRVTIEGGHALHWSKPADLVAALATFWRAGAASPREDL